MKAAYGALIGLAFGLAWIPSALHGQTPPAAGQSQAVPAEVPLRPSYSLGTNDQIQVRVNGVEDFEATPYRVDENGDVTLPLIGKVRASGLTLEQLEREIVQLLRKFVVEPGVSVSITQFRAEPVFIVGAFLRPGLHPLQGRRTLLDTLTTVGGLQANASRRIKVTRRSTNGRIPLPAAIENSAEGSSTVEIHLNRLMETVNPAEDIVLQPFDVITASKVAQVYVTGEVARPGPFDVLDGESVTLIQLITVAGGITPSGNAKNVRLLRPVLATRKRAEIRLNLEEIYAGRQNDFPIMPNDVLFIPKTRSLTASIGRTVLLVAPGIATGVLISLIRR